MMSSGIYGSIEIQENYIFSAEKSKTYSGVIAVDSDIWTQK